MVPLILFFACFVVVVLFCFFCTKQFEGLLGFFQFWFVFVHCNQYILILAGLLWLQDSVVQLVF